MEFENMFRVVGVLDDERIALYDGAHPLAAFLLVLRLHGGDGWHKDPVHMHFREAADMAVDKLCREAPCQRPPRRDLPRESLWLLGADTRTVKPKERKNVDQKGMVSPEGEVPAGFRS